MFRTRVSEKDATHISCRISFFYAVLKLIEINGKERIELRMSVS